MGFVTQYGQEQEISATWNLADITFGNANFHLIHLLLQL